MKMRKLILLAVSLFVLISIQVPVMAQGTILPKADEKVNCEFQITEFNNIGGFSKTETTSDGTIKTETLGGTRDQLLGCAIMTGRISLAMIPYFIQYFSNFLLGIVSLVALLFVVIGGFMYTLGGMIPQQKDKGKTYVTNALIGMVIAFLAWSLVNVLISALTG